MSENSEWALKALSIERKLRGNKSGRWNEKDWRRSATDLLKSTESTDIAVCVVDRVYGSIWVSAWKAWMSWVAAYYWSVRRRKEISSINPPLIFAKLFHSMVELSWMRASIPLILTHIHNIYVYTSKCWDISRVNVCIVLSFCRRFSAQENFIHKRKCNLMAHSYVWNFIERILRTAAYGVKKQEKERERERERERE